jgi:hypothetical protein
MRTAAEEVRAMALLVEGGIPAPGRPAVASLDLIEQRLAFLDAAMEIIEGAETQIEAVFGRISP